MSKRVTFVRVSQKFGTTKILTQGSLRKQSLKKQCFLETFFTKANLWSEFFMVQINSVVTEKHEYEKRHLTKLRDLWEILDSEVSDAENRIKSFLKERFDTS